MRRGGKPRRVFLQIYGRIHAVHILLIQLLPQQLDGLGITINMKYQNFHVISILFSFALMVEIKTSTTAILSLTESSSHFSIYPVIS